MNIKAKTTPANQLLKAKQVQKVLGTLVNTSLYQVQFVDGAVETFTGPLPTLPNPTDWVIFMVDAPNTYEPNIGFGQIGAYGSVKNPRPAAPVATVSNAAFFTLYDPN